MARQTLEALPQVVAMLHATEVGAVPDRVRRLV
jgi:hypothetical protein